jgi:NADPH:quinone reductase-like Zn-dependent oxidoreductase
MKITAIYIIFLDRCFMQYVEVPAPTPKKDEVLIKVEAASLSPVDWRIQQGMLRPMFPREFPQIPGNLTVIWFIF